MAALTIMQSSEPAQRRTLKGSTFVHEIRAKPIKIDIGSRNAIVIIDANVSWYNSVIIQKSSWHWLDFYVY